MATTAKESEDRQSLSEEVQDFLADSKDLAADLDVDVSVVIEAFKLLETRRARYEDNEARELREERDVERLERLLTAISRTRSSGDIG